MGPDAGAGLVFRPGRAIDCGFPVGRVCYDKLVALQSHGRNSMAGLTSEPGDAEVGGKLAIDATAVMAFTGDLDVRVYAPAFFGLGSRPGGHFSPRDVVRQVLPLDAVHRVRKGSEGVKGLVLSTELVYCGVGGIHPAGRGRK